MSINVYEYVSKSLSCSSSTPQVHLLNYWHNVTFAQVAHLSLHWQRCWQRSPPSSWSTGGSPNRNVTDSVAAQFYPPKNQAKRNSIASSFLDCGCGTGNRPAFHNLSRMRSVALSQIVRIAVMNREESLSRAAARSPSRKYTRPRIAVVESVVREAGQRRSAETLSDVIHSGENEAENGFRSTRNDRPRPRPRPKLLRLFFLVHLAQ